MAKLKDGTRIYGNANVNATLTTADLVVTGNITIQGTTTTIDTSTTRIEDPLMELGGGPAGNALTTDDGLERGLLMHYYASGTKDAFMGWNTSAGEFSLASNVTYTGNNITSINEYGNVQAGHFIGEGDTLGNITGANVTGTVKNANMSAYAANVTNASQPNITSLGNLTSLFVGNSTSNTVFGNGTITATGTANIGGDLNVTGNANIGNLKVDGTITGNFSGSTSAPGSNTQIVFNDANVSNASAGLTFVKTSNALTASGTITGGNLSTAGTLSVTGNANVGNIGTVSVVATGNISTGNVTISDNAVNATGNVTAGNLTTGGVVSATGNVSGNNLTTTGDVTTGTVTATGNISTSGGNISAGGNASITGTATVGNLTTGGDITGTGGSSTANVQYLTVRGTANITSTATAGNLVSSGYANVTGNVVGGNLVTTGTANIGNLVISGNVTGNLIPSANATYDLGSSGAVWKDLWLSGTSIKLGSQTISSNTSGVSLSNAIYTTDITASNLMSTLTMTASGAITGANVTANNLSNTQVVFANGKTLTGDSGFTFASGTLSANLFTGTLTTNAQPNITSVGTLTDLTVTNVATANINGYAATVSASAQSNITSLGTLDSLVVSGNIQSNANVITDNILAKSTNITITAGAGNSNISLAPTGNGTVDVSNKRITGLATPTQATDAATKGYVDGASQGLDIKNSVRVATTTNITLTVIGTSTVDGVTLATGDRVLVKNQTNKTQNGIYVVPASGNWARSADADQNGELTAGSFTFVEEGTSYADSGWVISTNGEIVIGSDNIEWTQFSGSGSYSASSGVQLIGSDFSAKVDGSTIDIDAGALHVKNGLTLVTPNIGAATGDSLDLGTGNITAGNAIIGGGAGGSITGANLLSATYLTGTITTAAQPNITSVGTLGNVNVATTLNVASNAFIANANGIYTNGYYYANGDQIDFQTASGNAYELQFHASGANDLASSANLTFNGNALSVTGTANVSSTLTAGNVVSNNLTDTRLVFTDSNHKLVDSGNLTFSGTELGVSGTANVSGTVIAGNIKTSSLVTGRITFQGAGNILTDDAGLTYDASYDELQSGNANVVGYITAGNVTARNLNSGSITFATSGGLLTDSGNLTFNTSGNILGVDNVSVSNTVTAGHFSGEASGLSNIAGGNVVGQVGNASVAGTVYTNAQPNITSVGTLANLTVSGTTSLGNVGNITITGGSNGYALFTDGSGHLTWNTIGTAKTANGTSSVDIPIVDGNIELTSGGNLVLTVTGVGANVTGTLDVTGNINGNNISAANTITASANVDSTSSITGTVKVTGGMAATGNIYTGHSVGFANNNGGNTSKAYIQFNETANSLDFIFN